MQTLRWAPLLGALLLAPLPGQAMAKTLNLTLTGVASPGFQDALSDPSMGSPTTSFAGQPVTIRLALDESGAAPSLNGFALIWSDQTFSLPVMTSFNGSGAPGQFLSQIAMTDGGGTIDITASPTYMASSGGHFDLDLNYAMSASHSPSSSFGDTVTGGGSVQGFVPFPNNPTFGSFDNTVTGDFTLTSITASLVPEPSVWATMLVGLFGLGAALRARRRQDRPLRVTSPSA